MKGDEKPALRGEQTLGDLARWVVSCRDEGMAPYWVRDYESERVARQIAERIRDGTIKVRGPHGKHRSPGDVYVFECRLEPATGAWEGDDE